VWISPTAYGFEERRDGRWHPLDERPLATTDWRAGARAVFEEAATTRISFDTIGRADQTLSFTLSRNGERAAMRVGLDGQVSHHE
jgi:general secretion pathway protein H